jgi:hypothetical protein
MAPAVRGPDTPGPSLLASEAKWRKLKINVCLEEEVGEELESVRCCCLEGPIARVWKISSGDYIGC